MGITVSVHPPVQMFCTCNYNFSLMDEVIMTKPNTVGGI